MARIPLGNFGQVAVSPEVQTAQVSGGSDAVAAAVDRLGRTVGHIADQQTELERQREAEAKRQAEAMARAKAADVQVQYELDVQSATLDVSQQVQSGAVPYQQADAAYKAALDKITPPSPGNLDPALAVHFQTGLTQTRAKGQLAMRKVATDAQQADFRGQFGSVLDKLGKLAGLPGADVAQINARAEAFAPLARQAGLDEGQVSKALQDFKDANWTGQATQRAMAARNSVGQLDQVARDLTDADGFYADKLDAPKRNALLSQVLNRKQMLIDRAEHVQDRADAKAGRVLAQIDQQIASGVPATPDMWAEWADQVKGSTLVGEFRDRVQDEIDTQRVLRLPPDQQATYIQQATAKLQTEGGTPRDAANVARLQRAVTANIKQMQDNPLLFQQARLGDAVAPLDVAALGTPEGSKQLGQQLQDRAATIGAMRKQYGAGIPDRLLLPQEAQGMQAALAQGTPAQKTKMLGMVRQAIGDDGIYNAVMQQLAPDAPMTAYAGMLAARERSMTLATHWFKPNDVATSGDVAATLLQGAELLQGKGDKAFKAPKDTDFRQAFTDATGKLFAGRPGAADVAMQAVKSYYVGKSAADGDVSGEVDGTRLQQAIAAALGNVADVNGNGEVLAPWGMDADTFETAAEQAFDAAVKAKGITGATGADWSDFGLQQRSGNTYYVTHGRSYLYDAHGQPILLQVGEDKTP
jgi:hypothetical protein